MQHCSHQHDHGEYYCDNDADIHQRELFWIALGKVTLTVFAALDTEDSGQHARIYLPQGWFFWLDAMGLLIVHVNNLRVAIDAVFCHC